jgi:hypothetical protein
MDETYEEWKSCIGYTQYRVFEQYTFNEFWYPHGPIHENYKDAKKDLEAEIKRYAKYGRVFELRARYVEYWVPLKKERNK